MVAALNSRPQICTSYLYHHPPSVSSVSEGEPWGRGCPSADGRVRGSPREQQHFTVLQCRLSSARPALIQGKTAAIMLRKAMRRKSIQFGIAKGDSGGVLLVLMLLGSIQLSGVQTPAELQQHGVQAFHAGEFALAEHLFSQLVRQDPSPMAFSYLATAEGAMGEYRQAIVHFRKSIELGNDTPVMRYNLALSYLKDNQLGSAITELKRAVAKNPEFVAARYTLGVALLHAGEPREAIANLKQTQEQLSKKPEMWLNLVDAEFRAGDTREALHALDKSVDSVPQNPRFFVELAQVCLNHEQSQKARGLLENASELAPRDNRLKVLLAEISLNVEEPEETLAVLEGVPASAGNPGQVDFLRGRASLLKGDLTTADASLSAAVAANPQQVDYLSVYAELKALEQDYEGALTKLKTAEKMHPHSPGLAYQTAFIYTLMQRYANGIEACTEATRLAPNFDQAYFLLGAIEFEQKDWPAAEAAFRHALALRPRSAFYHAALGATLYEAGSLSESRRELDEAVHLDPHTLMAYFWRAEVSARQNDRAKAIADLEILVTLDSNYPEAYELLARLYTAEKQRVNALDAQSKYDALEQKVGARRLPLLLRQLGMTHFLAARGRSN
jgi:tetratricopeptide (TPR) repeat protein